MALMLFSAISVSAQSMLSLGEDTEDSDSLSEFIRENPDLGTEPPVVSELPVRLSDDYGQFPFLHLSENVIKMNGADWSDLKGRFAACNDTLISIVHIGDSHIQAEGSTSRTRSLLQSKYGSAGRGLVIPFKIAGTNSPLDYSITSTSDFTVAKIMKKPWPIEMGFTGISLQPESQLFDFTISVNPVRGDPQEFEVVKMFAKGKLPELVSVSTDEDDEYVDFETAEEDGLTIYLSKAVSRITLKFQSRGECQIFGFLLDNFMAGVQYSAIGNNGAAFTSYNSIGIVGKSIKSLDPNLVILSLGTNEAFGKTTDADFYNNIDVLVRNIRRSNPDVAILLVTPAECQKSHSIRTGKRRKRVRTYSVNDNVVRMRGLILKYGVEHGIPTYDWYEVAGGEGSSTHWLEQQLMNTDRIHNTWSGYSLQGQLLYDALIDAIEK